MMTDWMRDRVTRAAQLFARNADWPAIAAEVNSRPEVCKRWPIQYVDVFMTAFKVEKMRISEENVVWLVTLRSLLDNKDEEVRRNAAVLWARYGWDLELEKRWELHHVVPVTVRQRGMDARSIIRPFLLGRSRFPLPGEAEGKRLNA